MGDKLLAPLHLAQIRAQAALLSIAQPGMDGDTGLLDALSGATAETDPGALAELDRTASACLDRAVHGFPANTHCSSPRRLRTTQPIILLVPDPIDSELPYLYDGAVAAAEMSIEAQGYLRDIVWTPWNDPWLLRKKDDTTEEQVAARARREVPGIMLFRLKAGVVTGKRPEFIVLFLVGETPTWGVQQRAMAFALDQSRKLLWAPFVPGTVPVVGPYFSGGAASMGRSLELFLARSSPYPRLQVVTGSATASSLVPALQSAIHTGAERVTFASTVVSDHDMECAMMRYLQHTIKIEENKRQPGVLNGVALLRESGTQYGANLGDVADKQVAGFERPGYCPTAEAVLRFPIHVAAVRNAYAAGESESKLSGPDAVARRTFLSVPLNDETDAISEYRYLSAKTSPARDIGLSHLLNEVTREGIHYLGIEATDISDAIFLARKVRDATPDVRLIFFANDILLMHPAFRRDLLGSYVVTPYPFLGSDDFMHRDPGDGEGLHEHRPFDSDVNEGIFNATALALKTGEPLLQTELTEYELLEPKDSDQTVDDMHLPIWISAIGVEGVEPLALRRSVDCCSLIAKNRSDFANLAELNDEQCEGRESVRSVCLADNAFQLENAWRDTPRISSTSELHVDADVTPPRTWQLVLALLCVLVAFDLFKHRDRSDAAKVRRIDISSSARTRELALTGLSYAMHRTFCTAILWVALLYMTLIQRLATTTYGSFTEGSLATWGVLAGGIAFFAVLCCRFFFDARDVYEACCNLQENAAALPPGALGGPPEGMSAQEWRVHLWRRRALRVVGLDSTDSQDEVIAAACRRTLWLSGALALGVALMVLSWGLSFHRNELGVGTLFSLRGSAAVPPNLSLFVLRTLPLLNGLSPAWPVLVLLGSLYVWGRVRMSKIWLVHGSTLLTSEESVDRTRGSATPIARVMLGEQFANSSFAEAERRVTLSALYPSGSRYVISLLFVTAIPIMLFVLKRPATLEEGASNAVLVAGLALAGILIGSGLVNLVQYWRSLQLLLTRVDVWRGIACLDPVEDPVRKSVLLYVPNAAQHEARLAACSELAMPYLDASTKAVLREHMLELRLSRSRDDRRSDLTEGDGIGCHLLEAAVRTVEKQSRTGFIFRGTSTKEKAPEQSDSTEAQLVGSMITICLGRYVRQTYLAMYSLTAQALLLLVAIEGYSFEPKRLLLTCVWTIMLTIAAIGAWILYGLGSSIALKRINRQGEAKDGGFSWSTFEAGIRWVAVPVLAVVAAEYPGLVGSLFTWMQPIMHALH